MRGLPPNPLLTQFRKLQPSPLEVGDHLIPDYETLEVTPLFEGRFYQKHWKKRAKNRHF